MTEYRQPQEYRILLRHIEQSEAGEALQFTAIVTAYDAEDAMSEAEKLAQKLDHRFCVVDIQPGPL